MNTDSSPDPGTAEVQSPHPDAGNYTVSLQRDVEVRLVPVGHENGDEDYHVYLEPVSEGDPALGTVMPFRPDGLWYVHLAPRYGDGAVANVGGLDLALRRLLELALDEDLNPKYVELPSRGDGAEEPEDEGEGLRDHVRIGLDVPISVTQMAGDEECYVTVELPEDSPGHVVGLIEPREDHWIGRAPPGFGPVCSGESMQEAIDGLVGYALEVSVGLREEMRDKQIV